MCRPMRGPRLPSAIASSALPAPRRGRAANTCRVVDRPHANRNSAPATLCAEMAMVLVLGSGKSVTRTTRPAASRLARPKSRAVLRLRWLIRWLSAWRRNAASWRQLATLNDYYLRDLGLSRHDFPPSSSPPFRLW
ncbi:MAG: hypothetical protein C0484_03090 [Rhodospirillum sp.]|nr:hypothetical protein [Rhodospirillum sp.]